jgi:hypothetical protein
MKDLDDEEKEGKISHKDNLAKNSGRTDEAHHETEVNNTMREPDSDIEESGELMPQPDTQGGAGASDESMEECPQDGNVQLSMSDLIKLIHQLQKGGPGVDADQTLLGDEEVEEEFGNAQDGAPGPEVAPVAAVTPTGDDMHSKGLEVHKMNGGGNPLHAHLAELYAEVKGRSLSENHHTRVISIDDFDFNPQPGDIITHTVFGRVKLLKITEYDINRQFAEGIVKTESGEKHHVSYEQLIGNDELTMESKKASTLKESFDIKSANQKARELRK